MVVKKKPQRRTDHKIRVRLLSFLLRTLLAFHQRIPIQLCRASTAMQKLELKWQWEEIDNNPPYIQVRWEGLSNWVEYLYNYNPSTQSNKEERGQRGHKIISSEHNPHNNL